MIATRTLLGLDEPLPEEVTIPGQVDPNAAAAAQEKLRRERIMVIGGVVILGIVVSGGLALAYFTKEPRSSVRRHGLHEGDTRCFSHVKYSVGHMGRLRRVGTC